MSRFREFFAGKPFSSDKTTRKKLLLALFARILLVTAVVGVVARVKSRENNSDDSSGIKISIAHAIARSSCSSTLYPVLCYSAIAEYIDGNKKVNSVKDVIILSLNVTIGTVQSNYFTIEKLLTGCKNNLTKREKSAMHDCLVAIDETLDELHTAVKELDVYPFKKSIEEQAVDLKTLLSSAITN